MVDVFRELSRKFCLAVLAAGVAGSAGATTIVPIPDEALVDRAPIVVTGRVEARLPAVGSRAVSRWLFRVERELKGPGLPSALVVELPGGTLPGGATLRVVGVPELVRGARLLLFLRDLHDGAHRVHQLPQGLFFHVRDRGRPVALQHLAEVAVVPPRHRARGVPASTLRDFDRFADWIADRAAGAPRPSDYRFRPAKRQMRSLARAFTLFVNQGRNVRWSEFDAGGSVSWRRNGALPGISTGGADHFHRAQQVWNQEPTTPIRLTDAGESTASGGLQGPDGSNVLLFGDPNEEIEDFDCELGGTLAYGAWWHFGETSTFNDRDHWRIGEGDIVTNDGLECWYSDAPFPGRFVDRLLAHELGHTLGIDHSSENPGESDQRLRDALMYYAIYREDPRGLALEPDDLDALRTLYRPGGIVPPPPPPPPPGPGGCPARTLCLLGGRFQVTATWENQFNGTSGTAGTIRASDVSGYLWFTDPQNYELIVKILDFGDVVKVFYGQLTNLRFEISVRDTRTGTVKTYTNTTGDCGGLDEQGFPSAAVAARFAALQTPHPAGVEGTCRADSDTMCLLHRRFALEVDWRNQYDGSSGRGLPRRLTELTGAFGFTSLGNVELLVKTLDFGDRLLVLYGALSNLEYRLTITDTVSGRVKTYANPAFRYCGGLDENF
jgi:hypothetical protein